ncbi:hypothetical protein NDI39_28700 [Microcoleus sp. ZQ-A2]|nr:hypothetical protein [Microcoleus sp. FACHB-1]
MNNQHNHTPKNSNTNIQNGRHLNTPVETVNPDAVSYEEGYVHGRVSERSLENQEQEVRSEHSAARGLLLGMALTSLVGLTVGAIFYLNQREESPTPTPVLVPARPAPQQPNRETTIIERTTEKIQPPAPINQEPSTAPQQSQPDIRIIVPNSGQPSAPAPQDTTPQTAPRQSQSQPLSPNPPLSQPNTSRGTSPTTPPDTTNQDSPAPSQKQIPTVTTPTEQPDTTNESSSEPTPNQTQPDSSNSDQ